MEKKSPYQWGNRTAQQLVSYEALFDLLDKIQPLEDIEEISRHVAKRWKYMANVASCRIVINNNGSYLVIDGFRGEAVVQSLDMLSSWDTHHLQVTKPDLFSIDSLPDSPRPPAHIINKSVSEINVIPFIKFGKCIGLLTVSAHHEPFTDLDKKFIRMFGSYIIDKIYGILLRQRDMSVLVNKATYDNLTGVLNRGAILDYLELILPVAKRTDTPISVILADIDFFKRVNDSYGHLVGDKVLVEIAQILQSATRDSDHFGRFGGEEFLFVLYPCESSWAQNTSERLRTAIEKKPVIINDNGDTINLTISLGVATFNCCNDTVEKLLARADNALYESKKNGRNCSSFSDK